LNAAQEIEGSAQLFTAEQVAKDLLDGLASGDVSITDEVLTEVGRIVSRIEEERGEEISV
jgi:hypothetical protein